MITPPSRASGAALKMKWSTTTALRLGHRLNRLFGNTSRFFTTANADIHGLVIWLPLCSHSLSHGWPLETGLSTIVRLPHYVSRSSSGFASYKFPTEAPSQGLSGAQKSYAQICKGFRYHVLGGKLHCWATNRRGRCKKWYEPGSLSSSTKNTITMGI